jgi:hypothetical protein
MPAAGLAIPHCRRWQALKPREICSQAEMAAYQRVSASFSAGGGGVRGRVARRDRGTVNPAGDIVIAE